MAETIRAGQLVARYLPTTQNWIHTLTASAPGVSSIVLSRGPRENVEEYPAQVISLANVDPSSCAAEADAWFSRGLSHRFLESSKQFGCEVLHAHFGTEGALGLGLARALGVPLVTSFYGYDAGALPRDRQWRPALRALFAHGTLFCAEGPALAARLADLGCPSDRIRLVTLPIPTPPIRTSPREIPLILICGRFVEKKGIDDALRALAHVKALSDRPFSAIVVGDGPARTDLETLHADLGLGDAVRFAGALPVADLRRLLTSTSLVLQMSRTAADGDTEGGAPVILTEALAHGVACVSTTHADIPYVVDEGRTGLLVAERDWRASAERVAALLQSPDVLSRMGQEAFATASTRFSPHAGGLRLRAIYEDAIAIGPSRAERIPTIGETVAVSIAIRQRGGDLQGLTRTLARPLARAHRLQALRAAAAVAPDPHRRAAYLRDARRLDPSHYGLALDEAQAWLEADDEAAAAEALGAYLGAHPDRAYAWAVVRQTSRGRRRLLETVAREAGTDAERFDTAVAFCLPAHSPRALVTRGATLLRRSSRHSRALIERALCELAAADNAVAPLVRRAGLQSPLALYRIASLLEQAQGAERKWAFDTFVRLARRGSDRALRAGAAYHVARMLAAKGLAGESEQWVRRCLALEPGHAAARALMPSTDRIAS